MEWDDSADFDWCEQQFSAITKYVAAQQIPHGLICDWPEWYTAPYVGLWVVEDPADPGYAGHWILGGDSTGVQPQPVPFDHVAATDLTEPREAMAAFAKRWAALAAKANRGESWQGSPVLQGDLPTQAKQLARQAQLLAMWANDEELWAED